MYILVLNRIINLLLQNESENKNLINNPSSFFILSLYTYSFGFLVKSKVETYT